jgi:3-hydroxyisobutyrate dehydrogenase-like beta-hydroxyacid dehydrogenase
MSEQVILGADGIASGAKSGTVVVDASTVSPASSRHVT